jgi:hypothetical protein
MSQLQSHLDEAVRRDFIVFDEIFAKTSKIEQS